MAKKLSVIRIIVLPDGTKKREEELTPEERLNWQKRLLSAYPRAMGLDYEIYSKKGEIV